jgi:hypothetical protein
LCSGKPARVVIMELQQPARAVTAFTVRAGAASLRYAQGLARSACLTVCRIYLLGFTEDLREPDNVLCGNQSIWSLACSAYR